MQDINARERKVKHAWLNLQLNLPFVLLNTLYAEILDDTLEGEGNERVEESVVDKFDKASS
jgi:hypothetical protein